MTYHVADPAIGLPLGIYEEWPSLGMHHQNSILCGQEVSGQTIQLPFSDHHGFSKRCNRAAAGSVWHFPFLEHCQPFIEQTTPVPVCEWGQVCHCTCNNNCQENIFLCYLMKQVNILKTLTFVYKVVQEHNIPSSTLLSLEGEVASLSGTCELVQSCLSSTKEMSE